MKTFTQLELRTHLASFGIPAYFWQLADSSYETVSDDYIPQVWAAWIDSLRRNAPQLLTTLDIGGGKTRIVPRWQAESGDCDNHALLCFAHAMMGNWIGGGKSGRTFGIAFYTASPRLKNRKRSGGHAVCWWINHEGTFRVWEPADGEEQPWTPEEFVSATFGIAA